MLIILAGIAVFINLLLLFSKLKCGLYFSFLIDILALVVTTFVFAGTYSGMAVGFIGNALFSLYLLYEPIKLKDLIDSRQTKQSCKK